MVRSAIILTVLAAAAMASKDSRTFAVLRFYGPTALTTCRLDPIISPGVLGSRHLHTVQGGSNFGPSSTGEQLLQSNCTSSLLKNDKSNYWFPTLFFQDPQNGCLTQVDLFYVNIYYFFEPTQDEIQAFPVGLSMVSGDAMLKGPPPNATGTDVLDPSQGTINPVQITCPRENTDPPGCPAGSDGYDGCIQDPGNAGAQMGFPMRNCEVSGAPLRADIHFPSCYNPAAGLTKFTNNMAWPMTVDNWQNCPEGYIHVPHLFYEVYWDTPQPKYLDLWQSLQGDPEKQPFLFANGDKMGFSSHGDFMAAWDVETLQTIIDTCDTGDSGMDKCPTIIGGLNDEADSCTIPCPVDEVTTGLLTALPGDNPVVSWPWSSGADSAGSSPSMSAGLDSSGSTTSAVMGCSIESTSSANQMTSLMSIASASGSTELLAGTERSSTTAGGQGAGVLMVTVTAQETQWAIVTVSANNAYACSSGAGGDGGATGAAMAVLSSPTASSSSSSKGGVAPTGSGSTVAAVFQATLIEPPSSIATDATTTITPTTTSATATSFVAAAPSGAASTSTRKRLHPFGNGTSPSHKSGTNSTRTNGTSDNPEWRHNRSMDHVRSGF